jgi:hypothetical protein
MSNSEQSNNPITLEKWTNNSNGQTVTVIRGMASLEVHGRIILLVQDKGDDRVLLVYPDGNKGHIAPLSSLKKEGYTLQPEAPTHPPEVANGDKPWEFN